MLDSQANCNHNENSGINEENGYRTTHRPLYGNCHLDKPHSPQKPPHSGNQLQIDDGGPNDGNDGWHTPRSSTYSLDPCSPTNSLPLTSVFSAIALEDDMEMDIAQGTKRQATSLSPTRSPQEGTLETKTITPPPRL